MKMTFLGTGSAFTLENYQSNILVEAAGKSLLIDCGGDARRSLAEHNLTALDITDIYISHLHTDHIGGLEWLGLSSYFARSKIDPSRRPRLHIREELVHRLWQSLHGGMGTIQGLVADFDTFFDVRPISPNGSFEFADTEFLTVQVIHYYDGFDLVPSFGLLLERGGIGVFITTDAQLKSSKLHESYAVADIIFQDCETSEYPSGVHSHYEELKSLDDAIKNRMWLYDYQDGAKPDCLADGFLGWAQKGQVFDFDDPGSFKLVRNRRPTRPKTQ